MVGERRPAPDCCRRPQWRGKTSITEAVLRHQWMQGCEYINPDNIARDLFGDWNSLTRCSKRPPGLPVNGATTALSNRKSIWRSRPSSRRRTRSILCCVIEAGLFVRLFCLHRQPDDQRRPYRATCSRWARSPHRQDHFAIRQIHHQLCAAAGAWLTGFTSTTTAWMGRRLIFAFARDGRMIRNYRTAPDWAQLIAGQLVAMIDTRPLPTRAHLATTDALPSHLPSPVRVRPGRV